MQKAFLPMQIATVIEETAKSHKLVAKSGSKLQAL